MTKKACKDCAWKIIENGKIECRYNPPSAQADSCYSSDPVYSLFPIMQEDDWCWKFKKDQDMKDNETYCVGLELDLIRDTLDKYGYIIKNTVNLLNDLNVVDRERIRVIYEQEIITQEQEYKLVKYKSRLKAREETIEYIYKEIEGWRNHDGRRK